MRPNVADSGGEAAIPAALAAMVETYVAEHPAAAVLEDGRVVFDMRSARYSVAESHGRCMLQLWSEERNLVRTLVAVRHRTGCLRLMTRRMGAAKPSALELVPTSDRHTPTAREGRSPPISPPPRAGAAAGLSGLEAR
jgi:hypothetical protein